MNINLTYPTSWQEVKREHLLILGKLMQKKLTREELMFDLLCKITGIKLQLKPGEDEDSLSAKYLFKMKGKGHFWMPVSVIRQACEDLTFLIDSIGLPECPILSVNTKLHGISFRSYYFADNYLSRYQVTKDEQMMLMMHYSLTGKKLKYLTPYEVSAYIIWWCGLKEFFKNTYPEVLQEGTDSTDKTPADILQELLSILNQNHPDKNEDILNADVHAVFHALNNIYLLNKKQ